ncbi:MAG: HigA family addiction module antitoxin [Xanthobacteraceae bacterium]
MTAHPGRLLKRELTARELSANRLAIDIGVPSGRITDILNGRRSITADTSVRLGRYFGNSAQFWLDLQSQHDIAWVWTLVLVTGMVKSIINGAIRW